MNNFTVHFDTPIIRGKRILIRATYGNTSYNLANLDEADATARIVPTPSGGIELITVRIDGQVVAFEMDSFNALEFHEYLISKLPAALRPAPMTRAQERQIILFSRHYD